MRSKDYELVFDVDTGRYEAREGNGNSLYNRIWTAINIRKGTLVCNHNYGSNLHKVQKALKQNETLIKTYVKDCLKPLSNVVKNLQVGDVFIDTVSGQATFSVRCERNGEAFNFEYWIKI